MYAHRAEHADVLRHGEQSLRLFRGTGNRLGAGIALNVVGWAHAQLGAYRVALGRCREDVELSRELGHRVAEAAALDSLGQVEHHLRDYPAAAAHYREQAQGFARMADGARISGTAARSGPFRERPWSRWKGTRRPPGSLVVHREIAWCGIG